MNNTINKEDIIIRYTKLNLRLSITNKWLLITSIGKSLIILELL